MAASAEKKEPVVDDVSDDEFELMFGKASEEGAGQTDLSKSEKTPEELEAEKKAAEEVAKVDEKTDDKPEDVAKVDEKTPEELEAEKKVAAEKVVTDTKAEEKRVADKAVADEAKVKKDAADKEVADERTKRATLAEDEKALEAEVGKDFPDVAKLMATQQRIMDAKNEIRMAEFQDNLIKQLGPTIQTVNAVATDSWERQVFDKHPDTMTLLPDVEAWVETQPSFLRAGYNAVLDKGTPAETIELMDTFKAATGITAPGKTAEEVAAETKVAEDKKKADEEREKKLLSQEGVRGRQDAKTDTAPSTFEDAFNLESSKVA
jgi:small-conductance mechanosensitive channel